MLPSCYCNIVTWKRHGISHFQRAVFVFAYATFIPVVFAYPKTFFFGMNPSGRPRCVVQGQLFGNQYPDEIEGQGPTRSQVSLFGGLRPIHCFSWNAWNVFQASFQFRAQSFLTDTVGSYLHLHLRGCDTWRCHISVNGLVDDCDSWFNYRKISSDTTFAPRGFQPEFGDSPNKPPDSPSILVKRQGALVDLRGVPATCWQFHHSNDQLYSAGYSGKPFSSWCERTEQGWNVIKFMQEWCKSGEGLFWLLKVKDVLSMSLVQSSWFFQTIFVYIYIYMLGRVFCYVI